MSRISLTDIILGIAYNLPREARRFVYDSEKFHTFFYKQRKMHPSLIDIRFDFDGRYPISPDLEEAITTLFASNILSFGSLDFQTYSFDDEAVDYFFEIKLTKLSPFKKRELEEISSDFIRVLVK